MIQKVPEQPMTKDALNVHTQDDHCTFGVSRQNRVRNGPRPIRNGKRVLLGRAFRFIGLTTIALPVISLLFAAGDTFAQSRAEAGRTLAREWCSSCHLVEMAGNARDTAPPFSTLAQQRDGDMNWVRTRMQVPLYPMQGINLSRSQIEDIVAYFESLRAEAMPAAPGYTGHQVP